MTIVEFPIGYFYIISQLNGLVLDVFDGENGQVSTKKKRKENTGAKSLLFLCYLLTFSLFLCEFVFFIGWIYYCYF